MRKQITRIYTTTFLVSYTFKIFLLLIFITGVHFENYAQINAINTGRLKCFNGSHLRLQNNFKINSNVRIDSATSIYLGGNNTQTITGADTLSLRKIYIDNNRGVYPKLVLEIEDTLQMINGTMGSHSYGQIHFLENSKYLGYNSSGYLQGLVKKTGNDSFIFPVGANGNQYFAKISETSNLTDVSLANDYSVKYVNRDLYPNNSVLNLRQGQITPNHAGFWEFSLGQYSAPVSLGLSDIRHNNCEKINILEKRGIRDINKGTGGVQSDFAFIGNTGNSCTKSFNVTSGTYTTGFVSDCANQVCKFPYLESFESGFGYWKPVEFADTLGLEWIRQENSFPALDRGASKAHHGRYFVYLNHENLDSYGDYSFYLTSYLESVFDFSSLESPEFSVKYLGFKNSESYDQAGIHIEVEHDGQVTGIYNQYRDREYITFRTSNSDGRTKSDSPYRTVSYDLSDFAGKDSVIIRLVNSPRLYYGQPYVCFDYIRVGDKPSRQGKVSNFPYVESFENDLGAWNNNNNNDEIDWKREIDVEPRFGILNTADSYGPEDGESFITLDNNHYPYSSYPTYADGYEKNKNGYLEADFDFTNIANPQLDFNYYFFNGEGPTLSIEVIENGLTDTVFYRGDIPKWHYVKSIINLKKYAGKDNITIRFNGNVGNNASALLSLDLIRVYDACTFANNTNFKEYTWGFESPTKGWGEEVAVNTSSVLSWDYKNWGTSYGGADRPFSGIKYAKNRKSKFFQKGS